MGTSLTWFHPIPPDEFVKHGLPGGEPYGPTINTIGVGKKLLEFHSFYSQLWIGNIRWTQRISSLAFKL